MSNTPFLQMDTSGLTVSYPVTKRVRNISWCLCGLNTLDYQKKKPTPLDIFDKFPSDISALHFELGMVKYSKLSCGYDFGTNASVAVGGQ